MKRMNREILGETEDFQPQVKAQNIKTVKQAKKQNTKTIKAPRK